MTSRALKIPESHVLPNLILDSISSQQLLCFIEADLSNEDKLARFTQLRSPQDTLIAQKGRVRTDLTYHTPLSRLFILDLKRPRPRDPINDLSSVRSQRV